jgi:PAS domain S-box-containing protein
MSTGPIGRLLIVDDEGELMTTLCETLERAGFETVGCTSGEEALRLLSAREFDLLLSDVMMPGMSGLELLRGALQIDPNLVGIMMTGQGTIQTAVEAMKSGAFDYILKPFKLADLLPVIGRAMAVRQLRLENVQLRESVGMYELAQVMAFSLDTQTILDKLVDAAIQQCGAEGSSVMLPTPDGNDLYVASARGPRSQTILGERMAVGEGISGWVARNRETLSLHKTIDDPRLSHVTQRPGIVSSISMPMLAAGQLVGVLNVDDSRRTRPFSVGQLKALGILAGLGTAALQSAHLYDQVREAEKKYRTLVDQLPVITYVDAFNGGRKPIYVSPQVQSLLGFSVDEWLADPKLWQESIHPQDRQRTLSLIEESLNSCGAYVCEYRLNPPDRDTLWVQDEGRVISTTDDKVHTVQGVMVNVTALKLQEQAARRQAAAIEQAAEAIAITDQTGRIEYVNPALLDLSGYAKGELLGQQIQSFQGEPEDASMRSSLQETLKKGQVWKGRIATRSKDARTLQIDLTVSAVRDEEGKVASYVGIGHDVTEQLDLQRKFLQAQKMEAVGALAGGVAHDFNNILTVVSGFAELLMAARKPEQADYEDLEKVVSAARRGAELVRRLMTFSRKTELQKRPLQLNSEIEELKKLLSRTISKMIEIELRLAPDLRLVNADPVEIEQLLINLALNARDAMPDGGTITLETRNVTWDEECCRAYLEGMPGEYVLVTVTDTGHGMDEETLTHIYEPFFTTKQPGLGTGLGLATVYGIAKQHGGIVACDSEPGRGTTFSLFLPVYDVHAARPNKEDEEEHLIGGTETLLVVDDEEFVRDLGERLLSRAGYTVITASNGREAVDIYSQYKDAISLVILDLVMPDMGGKECLKRLIEIDPGAKVLIASGYSAELSIQDCMQRGAKGGIAKPFKLVELLKHVRMVLDAT